MAKVRRGCAPALFLILAVVGSVAGFFGWRWYRERQPPPPSGKELRVFVLDVGPTDGDSILVISPEDKTVLIDAGDVNRGKKTVEALKKIGVQRIDYFIATHSHADHLGGAPDVLNSLPIGTVIDNGLEPPEMQTEEKTESTDQKGKGKSAKPQPRKPRGPQREPLSVIAYRNYKDAASASGAKYEKFPPEQKEEVTDEKEKQKAPPPPEMRIDLGGGAFLTLIAPLRPFFTRDQMRDGGNEPNANSIVARLDYGDFSMLLAGDMEAQSEARLVSKEMNIAAKILKVGHHGSKYASSEDFIKAVKPDAAIISNGEFNRYGHPAQSVLDRLKAANVKLYRTDLQGQIQIVTTGQLKNGRLYEIKTEKEAKTDLWAGREGQYDDSSRRGFIAYGDFGPPPKPPREKTTKKK
ncbi:MAG TPA: ComEC/Rec2 family competence protein [Pyrinomonadaceae bacterium]|nr:ComEC/Rec2 family competence protein [Pyrinomonadaceae bacterium]